jgi:hypothetical protein
MYRFYPDDEWDDDTKTFRSRVPTRPMTSLHVSPLPSGGSSPGSKHRASTTTVSKVNAVRPSRLQDFKVPVLSPDSGEPVSVRDSTATPKVNIVPSKHQRFEVPVLSPDSSEPVSVRGPTAAPKVNPLPSKPQRFQLPVLSPDSVEPVPNPKNPVLATTSNLKSGLSPVDLRVHESTSKTLAPKSASRDSPIDNIPPKAERANHFVSEKPDDEFVYTLERLLIHTTYKHSHDSHRVRFDRGLKPETMRSLIDDDTYIDRPPHVQMYAVSRSKDRFAWVIKYNYNQYIYTTSAFSDSESRSRKKHHGTFIEQVIPPHPSVDRNHGDQYQYQLLLRWCTMLILNMSALATVGDQFSWALLKPLWDTSSNQTMLSKLDREMEKEIVSLSQKTYPQAISRDDIISRSVYVQASLSMAEMLDSCSCVLTDAFKYIARPRACWGPPVFLNIQQGRTTFEMSCSDLYLFTLQSMCAPSFCRFIIRPLHIDKDNDEYGHACLLIFDRTESTLALWDPHGKSSYDMDNSLISNVMQSLLGPSVQLDYRPFIDMFGHNGPQSYSSELGSVETGQCVAWVYTFLMLLMWVKADDSFSISTMDNWFWNGAYTSDPGIGTEKNLRMNRHTVTYVMNREREFRQFETQLARVNSPFIGGKDVSVELKNCPSIRVSGKKAMFSPDTDWESLSTFEPLVIWRNKLQALQSSPGQQQPFIDNCHAWFTSTMPRQTTRNQ